MYKAKKRLNAKTLGVCNDRFYQFSNYRTTSHGEESSNPLLNEGGGSSCLDENGNTR